jgi:acyl-CoA synthetase (AMP-forming)/AMP-acid ligase II
MKYDATAKPARGELLLRGESLFSGYFKMQDKTVRSFWLRTFISFGFVRRSHQLAAKRTKGFLRSFDFQ